ncbi:MAG TPA: RNA polymerase sigma factor [Kofleriaceae bacterium]|nr:RNA polymerase sigma factor [Kofleriaceae bacterium]
MNSPFSQEEPSALIAAAQAGDRAALTEIIERHRAWIYNIALKMVWEPAAAEDVTQEILIKILRGLTSFEGKSSFRTWLYRIVVNHVLNLKRSQLEDASGSFDDFGRGLAAAPELPLPDVPQPERDLLVEEAKVGCLSGMLLCLSREQRLAYLLGSVFELPDVIAAELLEVSPETFRKRLSRAREDLHAFMTGQCGLVREENPCRCARKTAHFIKMGFVDPARLKFHRDYRHRIRDVAKGEAGTVFGGVTEVYPALYRDQPFADPPGIMEMLRRSLQGTQLGAIFDPDAGGA